jgi:hypothetical protein
MSEFSGKETETVIIGCRYCMISFLVSAIVLASTAKRFTTHRVFRGFEQARKLSTMNPIPLKALTLAPTKDHTATVIFAHVCSNFNRSWMNASIVTFYLRLGSG